LSTISKFTLRINSQTLDKLRYIADNNFRTVNKELTQLVVAHIVEYEKRNGEIVPPSYKL
jgi:hypothetical protein